MPGVPFQVAGLTPALDLLNLALSVPGIDEFPIERIEQEREWALLVRLRGGTTARFGLADRRRQFNDLITASRHARDNGYRIATIDLIPKNNIPVTLTGPPPPRTPPPATPPPRAIPVAEPAVPEPPPADPRERDLRALLNRG